MLPEVAPLPQFVVFADNEHSTNHKRALHQAKELDKIVPVRRIPTELESHLTYEKLHEELAKPEYEDPSTVEVLSGGGDGTDFDVFNALPGYKITSIRGGNACDFARSINGDKTAMEIMLEGRDAYFRPMEVTHRTPDGVEESQIVLGYFGIGADAVASGRYDEIKNTSNRFTRAIGFQPVREVVASVITMGGYKGFNVVTGEGSNEKENFTVDELFLRIPIIGKLGQTGVNPWQPAMKNVTTVEAGYRNTLKSLNDMRLGRIEGEMITEKTITVRSLDGSGHVDIEFNGEARKVPDDTEITVKMADVMYLTRSTRVSDADLLHMAA